MIGPASGGTVRGSGAPSRATGSRDTVGPVLIVLSIGLALRVIIAYLLPGSGFSTDLNAFGKIFDKSIKKSILFK